MFELPLVVEFIDCIVVDELVLLLTTASAGRNMLSEYMAAKRKIASAIDIARLTILIKCKVDKLCYNDFVRELVRLSLVQLPNHPHVKDIEFEKIDLRLSRILG